MIVNLQSDGWEIIYHRAHALLAAQIAGHWQTDQTTNRRYETVAAISHHDDLEKEWEGDQLTEAGAPLDFTLERENSLSQLRRLADEALYRGRWVALLISMHLCFLNQSKQNTDADIAAFIKEQYQRQQQWRHDLNVSKDEAIAAYDFMRWCDRLSLILCQHQVPAGGRKLEIITDYEGQSYTIFQSPSDSLAIEPWPFITDECCVSVDACYLDQLQFDSNDALKQALQKAPRHVITWSFSRASSAR
ncbi:DUF3891 family protein [Leptolyngbya iicbica]|uniref:DUF3891 family protein n=2 Tax=Cyanophyceae TaxID=3028117 RepID=A0A4Q7E6F3_9CYAN|nr:DUF3891 family protein [Leptolyngbya sp. LK]RZM78700.1 DUF3891 family protein [Leptolyngbya sp. LK]